MVLIMKNDLEKTKHYTTNSQKICSNLVKYIPQEARLIEPFVGEGDLLSLFPSHSWEKYDIEQKEDNIIQNTLLNPPDYKDKWVITNPPYLAKNKAKNKEIFNMYKSDDLYKIALKTMMDCSGGILIIPTNFFTDERTESIRSMFLNQFKILELNIFIQPIFDSTTYSVCSFAFQRKNIKEEMPQTFKINISPNNINAQISIYPEYNYRIGGEFYNEIDKVPNIFGRLIGTESNNYITNMKLYALDSRKERIHISFETEYYCGKNSDRVYATLTCKNKLSEEQERFLISKFNEELESFRSKYYDIPMTTYRDYNRKRISFTFAYKLLSKIYKENF